MKTAVFKSRQQAHGGSQASLFTQIRRSGLRHASTLGAIRAQDIRAALKGVKMKNWALLAGIRIGCISTNNCAYCQYNSQEKPTKTYPVGRCMLMGIPGDWRLDLLKRRGKAKSARTVRRKTARPTTQRPQAVKVK